MLLRLPGAGGVPVTRLPPLRAPAGDGSALAVPPLEDAGGLIARNRDRLGRVQRPLLGRPWQEVRALARRELIEAARRYMQEEARPAANADGPLVLAGHQPELFHPGVWVKHFALAGLARRHGGTAVNLLVDNDTVKSTSLFFPAQGDPWPHLQALPFDRWQGETPWEERRVLDAGLFERFGDEGAALMRAWGVEPILASLWPEVRRQAARRDGLLGDSFAAARRSLERSWGCANLEVPLSRVCQTEAFARAAGALFAELPRFVEAYNAELREHRRRHHIRSRHHPVPDLAAEGDWLEAPFWGWTSRSPRRGRPAGLPALPAPTASPERFVEAWRGLEASGHKVRSRALITTMFARLLLSDLFIHGIGGGKYDELTDAISTRFWGLEPPDFLVLSATCWLPLPAYPETAGDRRRLVQRLRDLRYNPQRHLPEKDAAEWAEVIAEKRRWIDQAPTTRAERRERFHQIRRLSEELWLPVAGQLTQAEAELQRVERHLEVNALLRRRDYSFCLFPEAKLRPFLTRFL